MFHWPLEFADVFYDTAGQPRARAGFDAVIGNPPWEMLRNETPGRTPHFALWTWHLAPRTPHLAP